MSDNPTRIFLGNTIALGFFNCTDDVTRVIHGIAVPLLQAMAKVFIALSILFLVMWIEEVQTSLNG